jgi:hypothetical protein
MRGITYFIAAATFGVSISWLTLLSARSPQQNPVEDQYSNGSRLLAADSIAESGTPKLPADGAQFVSTTAAQKPALAAASGAPTPPTPPAAVDLPALVRNAKEQYKPVAKADVLAKQVALEAAVHRLEKYLKNSGANGDNWSKYLGIPALQAELKNGLNASATTLKELAAKYTDGSSGLELAPFAGVAKTLRPYADVLAAYQNADAQAEFNRNLDALAAGLEAAAKQPGTADRAKLGELYHQIAATGQAPELAQQLRKQLQQPNLQVRVASPIVCGGMNDEIYEKTPVDDVILGTQIVGSGNTLGEVRASLIPSTDRAVVEIKTTGTNTSKTVGYHGMVTIFSHSTTSLLGRKRIQFDDQAFTGLPACANCCTNSTIDCIDVCAGPIITRIATRRVYGSHAEAEEIAGEHASARLEKRMDDRAAKNLTNLNRSYNNKFRNPLSRKGAYPQQLSYSTTKDWLSIVGLEAAPDELGATSPPPEQAADAQLSIRFHESLVDNGGGAMAPGKTVRSLAFRRAERNMLQEKYQPAEFADFLLCLIESGAPAAQRDSDLAIPFDQFQSMMKDRFNLEVTNADFDKLTAALRDGSLTEEQYTRYLAELPKTHVSFDDVKRMLNDAKHGDLAANYSAMTFADQDPISVRFHDNQFQLTMRIKSTTQPKLNADGKRVVNAFPAEIFVAYDLSLKDGHAVAKRVEKQYGVKQLPLPEGAEANLSALDQRRRSVLMTQTLPRRFFGGGAAGNGDEEEDKAEPIFPPERDSPGLTLRGPWQRLGQLPWTQLVAKDGWIALGWSLPPAGEGAE